MVFAQEGVGLVMAIVSIVTAAVAFSVISNAATDVAGIVKNWETQTVSGVIYQASAFCPTGYSLADSVEFPGTDSNMGCACPTGATFSYADGRTPTAVSSDASSRCATNQTFHSGYTCKDIPAATTSIPLTKYKGLWKCIKRDLASAIDQKYPTSASTCESGYYACGTGTSEAGVMCFPGSSGPCPVNWLGSTATLTDFQVIASDLTAALSGYTPVATTSGTAQTIYGQQGKVSQVKMPYWRPLGLVDISMNFGLPCYGESDTPGVTNNKLSSPSNSNTGTMTVGDNKGCSGGSDTRFSMTLSEDADSILQENFMQSAAYCSGATPSTDYNYFTSGIKCTASTSAAVYDQCLSTTTSTSGASTSTSCGASDKLCQQYFYQKKCGYMQQIKTSDASLQINQYMRTQIYWSETCTYTKDEVVDSAGPLKNSISVQTALLAINIIMNLIMIGLAAYVCYLCLYSEPGNQHYNDLHGIWKPRINTFGSFVKIPVIVATIVITSAIERFYVKLSEDSCSDALTDKTFDTLGKALPEVIKANITTLAMDVLMLSMTGLLALYAYCFPKKEEEADGLEIPEKEAS